MAELVAENARSANPARTPMELATALLQAGASRDAIEARLPSITSTLFGRAGGGGGATSSAGIMLRWPLSDGRFCALSCGHRHCFRWRRLRQRLIS